MLAEEAPENVELIGLTFDINGQKVAVEEPISTMSIQPIEEHYFNLNLEGFFPEELKAVKIDYILKNAQNRYWYSEDETIPDNIAVWARWGYRELNEDGTTSFVSENDKYAPVQGETLDLSNYYLQYYRDDFYLELIVGKPDQLDPANERYIVNIYTGGEDILEIKSKPGYLSSQNYDIDYERDAERRRYQRYRITGYSQSAWDGQSDLPITMRFNDDCYYSRYDTEIGVKVYEGYYRTAAEAQNAKEITDSIWQPNDEEEKAGYGLKPFTLQKNNITQAPAVTVVLTKPISDGGTISTAKPYYILAEKFTDSLGLDGDLYVNVGSSKIATSGSSVKREGEIETYTYEMQESYRANAEYLVKAIFTHNGKPLLFSDDYLVQHIKIAVLGQYTVEEAMNQVDIRSKLFGDGYEANVSGDGVVFTIVDQSNQAHYFRAKAIEYIEPEYTYAPSIATYMTMRGARKITARDDDDGACRGDDYYKSYYLLSARRDVDSYDNIYQTVFLLDQSEDENGDLITNPVPEGAKFYPSFAADNRERVYASAKTDDAPQTSGIPQVSGCTAHDFHSERPIQYTAYSEDGIRHRNYWVTFVTQSTGGPKLFVNGVTNAADAHKENGVPLRQVLLTGADSYHDIMIANTGDVEMKGMYVRLENAKGVKLDDYWTIKDDSVKSLRPFTTTEPRTPDGSSANYGELPNMAKIRLLPTDGAYNGDIGGTLVIGYDNGDGHKEEIKVNLIGAAGNLQITTEKLREGVKFVPYASAIQTNYMSVGGGNSRVKFEIIKGASETNVVLYPTGEFYGVPKGNGEWTFTVRASYDDLYGPLSKNTLSDSKEFKLAIYDNTDEYVRTVPGANGYDYNVLDFVGSETSTYHYVVSEYGNCVFRSEGEYGDFVNLYLDAELLVPDRDYSKAPGSTVITIFAETNAGKSEGKHTIAAEFFSGGNSNSKSTMRTSAQNYYLTASAIKQPAHNGGGSSGGSSGGGSKKPSALPNTPTAVPDGVQTPTLSEMSFTDVPKGSWYYEDVLWVRSKGLMKGRSRKKFDPNAPITQAMIVTTLARLADISKDSYEGETEEGIEPGRWFTTGAIWAKRNDILPSGTAFHGEDTINREQMAIMLLKFFRYMDIDMEFPEKPKVFADADSMSPEGREAFQILYKKVFKGVGKSHMNPNGSTTRAQLAVLLHRISDELEG